MPAWASGAVPTIAKVSDRSPPAIASALTYPQIHIQRLALRLARVAPPSKQRLILAGTTQRVDVLRNAGSRCHIVWSFKECNAGIEADYGLMYWRAAGGGLRGAPGL